MKKGAQSIPQTLLDLAAARAAAVDTPADGTRPTKLPAFMFYPGDWLKDTGHLTLAAKGAWIDLVARMWDAQIRGVLCHTIQGYARLMGALADQARVIIDELTDPITPVCDRKDLPDGRIQLTCRRMVREEQERVRSRVSKRRGRDSPRDSSPRDSSRDSPGVVPDMSREFPDALSSSLSQKRETENESEDRKGGHGGKATSRNAASRETDRDAPSGSEVFPTAAPPGNGRRLSAMELERKRVLDDLRTTPPRSGR